jgi:hypothetical protein
VVRMGLRDWVGGWAVGMSFSYQLVLTGVALAVVGHCLLACVLVSFACDQPHRLVGITCGGVSVCGLSKDVPAAACMLLMFVGREGKWGAVGHCSQYGLGAGSN